MNDFNLLLRSIITNPDEDSVRLAMADWYEEHGQPERAEFIRVQCELAKWRPYVAPAEILEIANSGRLYSGMAADQIGTDTKKHLDRHDELHRREQELFEFVNIQEWFNSVNPPVFHRHAKNGEEYLRLDAAVNSVGISVALVDRGFISSITCTAEDFLKHADQLIWHPTMTTGSKLSGTCPNRSRLFVDHVLSDDGNYCLACGQGQKPKPCPDTAQPIRKVKLTTRPQFHVLWSDKAIQLLGGDREWCQWPWDNVHATDSEKYCLEKEFRGIEFELPSLRVRIAPVGNPSRTVEVEAAEPIFEGDAVVSDPQGRAVRASNVVDQVGYVIGVAVGGTYT